MIKTNISFFLLALVFCPAISMGQVSLGVFGGLNSSKLSGDVAARGSYQSLMGGNFGALVDVKLSRGIHLSFQPSYSQEGTRLAYSVGGEQDLVDSVKYRLNYFSLPLLLKITSTNQRFYALTGIETGMVLHASSIFEESKEDLPDVAHWNLAAQFGAGIRIPLEFPVLFIELRYTQGLVNLTDVPLNTNVIPRVKTTGFKVICGIEVPLKNKKVSSL